MYMLFINLQHFFFFHRADHIFEKAAQTHKLNKDVGELAQKTNIFHLRDLKRQKSFREPNFFICGIANSYRALIALRGFAR